MSEYTVIGDVGDTIIGLLRENMSDLINDSSIVLFSPGEATDNSSIRLILFLYAIRENEHLKNQNIIDQDAKKTRRKPLTLDLYYMLTPYPSDAIIDLTSRTIDVHRILGRAMRVLYEHSILKGSVLKGDLAGSSEEFRIVQTTLPIQDVSQIWSTFQEVFYRLSVYYCVTPLNIDVTRETDSKRVVQRQLYKYHTKLKYEE